MKFLLRVFLLFCVTSGVLCVREKISPRMEFIDTSTNNTYIIYNKERDVASNPLIELVLQNTNKICTVGIWIFYPDVDFQPLTGLPTTPFQVGTSERYGCTDTLPAELVGMKSYRYLGPDASSANCDSDLNQFSITIYKEENAVGEEHSYCLIEFQSVPSFPFEAKSYVMTGITDEAAANQDTLAPVFQVFVDDNVNESSKKVCLALVNDNEEGVRSKLYYRGSDVGIPQFKQDPTFSFGSVFLLRYSTILFNPDVCDTKRDPQLIGIVKLPTITPPL